MFLKLSDLLDTDELDFLAQPNVHIFKTENVTFFHNRVSHEKLELISKYRTKDKNKIILELQMVKESGLAWRTSTAGCPT